jgi:Glycosyl hydrolases family 38 N-terminal domain
MTNKCMPSIAVAAAAAATSLTLLLGILLFSTFVKNHQPSYCWYYSTCRRIQTSSTKHTKEAASDTTDTAALRKFAAITDDPGVFNIHVVPHTHDDVGWRKTVEQYYYGYNTSIDTRGNVRDIISTVLQALLQNPARTFCYTESKFLSMWWNEQSQEMRDSLKQVIASQQFQIVNGGWCMHDEATAHYMGMMDQTTTGHAFLKETLHVIPRTAWQLDPFGHSATQASLFTARAGLDALYFGRIDYQDMAWRKLTQDCEGLWDTTPLSSSSSASYRPSRNSSSTLSEDRPIPDTNVTKTTTTNVRQQDQQQQQQHEEAIFWGLTGSYRGNYGPPDDSFCFDVLCPDTEPLVSANTSRLLQRMEMLLRQDVRIQAQQTRGQHIMLTMGTDFTYQDAFIDFVSVIERSYCCCCCCFVDGPPRGDTVIVASIDVDISHADFVLHFLGLCVRVFSGEFGHDDFIFGKLSKVEPVEYIRHFGTTLSSNQCILFNSRYVRACCVK